MNAKVFDFRRLRYFQTIAEIGSFSGASRLLNVAQPALTHQIAELEKNLGGHVFKRSARGVELTELGALLLRHSNAILLEVSAADQAINRHFSANRGTVTLGITPTLYDLAPALMTRFSAEFPKVNLSVSEARAMDSRSLIAEGKLDVAITFEDVDWHGGLPLGWERMCLVALPEHLSAGSATIEFEELARIGDLIMPVPNSMMRQLVDNAAAKAGVRLNFALEISGLAPRLQAVLGGFGKAILPLRNVERECKRGTLVARRIVNPSLDRRIVVHMAPGVSTVLIDRLRSFLRPLLGAHGVEEHDRP